MSQHAGGGCVHGKCRPRLPLDGSGQLNTRPKNTNDGRRLTLVAAAAAGAARCCLPSAPGSSRGTFKSSTFMSLASRRNTRVLKSFWSSSTKPANNQNAQCIKPKGVSSDPRPGQPQPAYVSGAVSACLHNPQTLSDATSAAPKPAHTGLEHAGLEEQRGVLLEFRGLGVGLVLQHTRRRAEGRERGQRS